MSADQLLQLVTQILFVLIFVVVAARAIRRRWRANVDTALLFGVASLLVAEGWVLEALGRTSGQLLTAVSSSLIMALPYLLVRLVEDFTDLPIAVSSAAALGLAASVVSFFVLKQPWPLGFILLCVVYFVGFTVYVAVAFVRAARQSNGVTRRRMQAVAAGSFCLALVIFLAGLGAALPALATWWKVLGDLAALGAGLGYFLGFAPPVWLRRTWQDPEVRTFLRRTSALPRLPDVQDVVQELAQGAANAFGAPQAVIGLWDQEEQVMRYETARAPVVVPADHLIAGRAFVSQQPVLSVNTIRDDPEHAELYRSGNAMTILAAPITAAEQRLGVLAVFGERAPIFAEDDLELVALLGAQAAVILESHFLIDEAAGVRAREEAARLKDDFLSAAAHDLKTPLTAVVAQAQLLERRTRRNPEGPIDVQGVERIVKEAQRLKGLVEELLDVTRAEQGKLVHRREPVDLVQLVREACERHSSTWHTLTPVVEESLTGEYDRQRILQLLDNLLENAVKYSPDGGEVRVALWRENDTAHLTVTDNGIGIPAADLPRLFDRFHRGGNVDDRRFAGLGLGLFICHGIVEQHGGSISASSPGPGRGSTFHVVLPCHVPVVETAPAVVRPISAATSSIPAVGEQAL